MDPPRTPGWPSASRGTAARAARPDRRAARPEPRRERLHGPERRAGRRGAPDRGGLAAPARAIDAAALPIAPAARDVVRGAQAAIRSPRAVAGGDDYELLFAVPRRARGRLRAVVRQARGVPLTRIGELTGEPEVVLSATACGTAARRVRPLLTPMLAIRAAFAAGSTSCCTRTTRRSGPRRPTRSASSSGSRRSSASTPCSARRRLRVQPEPGRGPARDLLEPALDPAGLLHAGDDARRDHPPRRRPARAAGGSTRRWPTRPGGSSGSWRTP